MSLDSRYMIGILVCMILANIGLCMKITLLKMKVKKGVMNKMDFEDIELDELEGMDF